MSQLASYKTTQWFTTPAELRQIAKDMEEQWRASKPGHDLTVKTIYGREDKLAILIDQDRIGGE